MFKSQIRQLFPLHTHSSSIGRSATFCILGSVLEQLKVEGIVDLFATIHSLRHQQPGLVNSFVSPHYTKAQYIVQLC